MKAAILFIFSLTFFVGCSYGETKYSDFTFLGYTEGVKVHIENYDAEGMTRAVLNGDAELLKPNTEIRVLSKSENISKVTIVGKDKTGFVHNFDMSDSPAQGDKLEEYQKDYAEFMDSIKQVKDSTITLSEFNQIKTGMSYSKVSKIIGSKGMIISESELSGIRTVMYQYEGEGSIGANANMTFQNGELINKAQFGLK